MEKRRRKRRRKERREKGGDREQKRERREGRLMSRQLHSRGHQSNTMQPVGCRCLADGQIPQLCYPLLVMPSSTRTIKHTLG